MDKSLTEFLNEDVSAEDLEESSKIQQMLHGNSGSDQPTQQQASEPANATAPESLGQNGPVVSDYQKWLALELNRRGVMSDEQLFKYLYSTQPLLPITGLPPFAAQVLYEGRQLQQQQKRTQRRAQAAPYARRGAAPGTRVQQPARRDLCGGSAAVQHPLPRQQMARSRRAPKSAAVPAGTAWTRGPGAGAVGGAPMHMAMNPAVNMNMGMHQGFPGFQQQQQQQQQRQRQQQQQQPQQQQQAPWPVPMSPHPGRLHPLPAPRSPEEQAAVAQLEAIQHQLATLRPPKPPWWFDELVSGPLPRRRGDRQRPGVWAGRGARNKPELAEEARYERERQVFLGDWEALVAREKEWQIKAGRY